MVCKSLGLPFCGAGSPVYGCSTIGLAHSRNLVVTVLARVTYLKLKNFPSCGEHGSIDVRRNFAAVEKSNLGLPFCGAGSPVYGCSTIGLAHSRNLSFKPFHAVCAGHVCLKQVCLKRVTAIARSLAETTCRNQGPFGCTQKNCAHKTALTKSS